MKIGDRVVWESQSQGSWKKKTGVIIADIPPKKDARKYVPSGAKKSHIKFDGTSCKHRMLVAVPAGKDGQITHYYCPHISNLRLVGDDA